MLDAAQRHCWRRRPDRNAGAHSHQRTVANGDRRASPNANNSSRCAPDANVRVIRDRDASLERRTHPDASTGCRD